MITETGIKKRKWNNLTRNSDYQWPKVLATMVNRLKGAYGDSYIDLYAFYDIN